MISDNNSLTILLYHGVTDCNSVGIENYSGKHISKEKFRIQMKYLSENCHILTMDEVCDFYNSGKKYPQKSAVVTFDDGFRNNFLVAASVLKDYNVPATFYITSGIVNTDIMFWVDQLEDCINLTSHSKLKITLENEIEFDLTNIESKKKCLIEIKKYCKSVSADRMKEILSEIIEISDIRPSVNHSPNYEKIKWNELKEMSTERLFTIGGHSMYHDILTSFSNLEKLEEDIKLSIDLLKYNLNIPIRHYAYPEGQINHYNNEVINILKKNNIICSPSAINGTNTLETDLFNLKRVMVGFNGIKFPFS